MTPPAPASLVRCCALLFFCACANALGRADPTDWPQRRDQLVARLRALAAKEDAFGPAYRPLYHAALPWYERWGGRAPHAVDDWMMPPDRYAAELADALEHGRNLFAEHPGALIPLVFQAKLPDGRTVEANYWLQLPTGFPTPGKTFPLIVGLHGSGWLGHAISFVRETHRHVAVRRAFSVTPIDEAGPWQIDFLNAYLDELLRILPVDPDHVYIEGHSLGAMATWEWALDNPERFAAISPRAGRGEPYRAVRLKRVPAWVIHGANDDVVLPGYAEQMVTALQDCGASVRYSLLPGVPHNMPEDLDEEQVIDWYLRQTRSHEAPPADPRTAHGLTPAGWSRWELVSAPAGRFWESGPIDATDADARRGATQALFQRAHAAGELVDAPVVQVWDLGAHTARLRLAVPRSLRADAPPTPGSLVEPAAQFARFYFRGTTAQGLAHLAAVEAEVTATGRAIVPGTVRITPLSIWENSATSIAEYRLQLR